jgi:acetoin utilization protein AcuB
MIPLDIKVQDYMTTPAVTIAATASLRDAGQVMKEYHIRHLPVVKNGKLVGILSSGDLRRASPSDAVSLSIWEINYLWDQIRVESAMTIHVITVNRDTPMIEAVRLMLEHRFNGLPVVDDDGAPIGMLTEVDVFRMVLRSTESSVKLVAVS